MLAAIALAAGSNAHAQQILSLDDAVARALARNHDIRIEREIVDASSARAGGAFGDYDPQLHIELGSWHRSDPATSLFSGAPAGKVASAQNGFITAVSLTQLFRSGAVASVSASLERDTTTSTYTLFTPAYVSSLGVDIRQPLLRSRAIDPT